MYKWVLKPIRRIGRGTFGEVLLAVKEKVNEETQEVVERSRECAVKKIVCRGIADANSAIQEAFQLRGHPHEHVIEYTGLFVEQDDVQGLKVCMEMPYYPAGDLATYLKRTLAAPPSDWPYVAVQISIQIADVLTYLQEQDFVHRDLKPQNILISTPEQPATTRKPHERPGGVPHIVLSDFGMLRKVEEQILTTQCGTPAFMSPEQVRGAYGPPADMWALGCMVYQMCTLTAPRVMYMEAFKRQRDGGFSAYVRAGVEGCGWPEWMVSLCVELLNEDPDRRPTAAEAHARLLEGQNDLPAVEAVIAGSRQLSSPDAADAAATAAAASPADPRVRAGTRGSAAATPSTTVGAEDSRRGRDLTAGAGTLSLDSYPAEVRAAFTPEPLEVLAQHGIEFSLSKLERGLTPLMVAAAAGSAPAVEALLKMGENPAVIDSGGRLALHHACESRSDKARACVRLLAGAAPAHIFEQDRFGQTPFHVAANNRHGGRSGSSRPGEGTCPKPECRRAHGCLRELLRAFAVFERTYGRPPEPIDLTDLWCRTPLHFVASRGCLVCSQALLAAGANPALKEAKYRSSPLSLSEQHHHHAARELFEQHLAAHPELVAAAERAEALLPALPAGGVTTESERQGAATDPEPGAGGTDRTDLSVPPTG